MSKFFHGLLWVSLCFCLICVTCGVGFAAEGEGELSVEPSVDVSDVPPPAEIPDTPLPEVSAEVPDTPPPEASAEVPDTPPPDDEDTASEPPDDGGEVFPRLPLLTIPAAILSPLAALLWPLPLI